MVIMDPFWREDGERRANVAENGLGERVFVEEGDALSASGPPVDLVLTNPPFHEAGTARIAAAREVAHVMPAGGLDAWIKAALARLGAQGRIVMIHRADALPAILSSLDRRFGGVQVIPVLPRADRAATRVLVTGVRGSRAPFVLRPPLVLHEENGTFTPLAAALHRGESLIRWGA
jgi:tRNA1(Val) A37 N6-methylase TrmN6